MTDKWNENKDVPLVFVIDERLGKNAFFFLFCEDQYSYASL